MPLYQTLTPGQWENKTRFLEQHFSPCRLCPRECGALRRDNRAGVCGAVRDVKVASFNLHHGEEPPITGDRGSGTIFFSGCPMKCVFCQNFPISHLFNGKFYSIEALAGLFLDLQARGAHNINFVSPSPYLYHAVAALRIACEKGLTIPVVYNTSGYEKPDIIRCLDGVVDIYLPDLKYHRGSLLERRYSGITGYFEYAYPAVEEMFRQVGHLAVDEEGLGVKGLIIRHLLLPGGIDNSRKVLDIIMGSPFKDAFLSIMCQYFPAYRAVDIPEINRAVSEEEYDLLMEHAFELEIQNGWFQDLGTQGKA